MMVNSVPFGLWSSPLTATSLSLRSRLGNVLWDSDGQTLVWLEGRSDRGVLVAQAGNEARRDLTDDVSVSGGVGYGGGEFDVRDGVIVFAERNGRLYRHSLGYGRPRPITPPFGAAASPVISPDGRWVVYVFSDGHVDLLGLVDSEGREWPRQIVRGADFYMQPVWNSAGDRLAWVEWDHPNMPWDGTRLKIGRLEGSPPQLVEETLVDGGGAEVAQQPRFSPDGRWLSYVVSSGEWDRLMLLDLESGERRILLDGQGFHLAHPAWVQGVRSYEWSIHSQCVFSIRNAGGKAELWVLPLDGAAYRVDLGPYSWLAQIAVAPVTDVVTCQASGPSQPERIICWDGQQVRVAVRSETELLAPEFFPQPQALQWTAPDGCAVYGVYWPPTNPGFAATGLPPAIVYIHGGPTSEVACTYSAQRTYFTSRGYGWLDVNYRGSTGYGRSYRNALRGRWGEADVEDAAGGAAMLAERGIADGKKLIILGGSAGGYTVLNALIHYPGRFKAGVCNYGVTNLFDLAQDTHKFEAHYNDSLVGALPEAAEKYHAWSPVFHVDQIRDALAVFQGSIDRVVPPSQSEQIVAVLRGRGVPHIYQIYEGEGHGFRKSETLADYYPRVERFLRQQVLFAV